LFALPSGQWTGPVDSPFGFHLLYVEQIVAGTVPPLADIRANVKREWLVDFRAAAQQEIIEQMKAKYTVTVEPFEAPAR
jgi:parvulin-like peptidyl-prolyl isomerase